MRTASVIAASIGSLLVTSSSFAGFTITSTVTFAGGLATVDVFARNTGGGTGTKLSAVDLQYNGSPVTFRSSDTDDDPSTPNEVDLANNTNEAGKSFLRIGSASNTFIVGASIRIDGVAASPTDPRFGSPMADFDVAYAYAGAPVVANTGAGARFARFIVPASDGHFTLGGAIGGDTGTSVPLAFNFHVDPPPDTPPPTIAQNSGANVVFGAVVSTPLPFSGTVTLVSPDAGTTVALALGTLPANVANVSITPAGLNPNGTTFTISGLVSYTGNGATSIPILASDNNSLSGDSSGVFVVNVTPEPASLSLVGLGCVLTRHQRR